MVDGADVVRLDIRRLLVRHTAGDPAAFPELVTIFKARVYGYIRRSGVPPWVADDLFQEVFLKIHRSASQYRPERPLEPWLFTIVANTVRSHFRAAGSRSAHESPADDADAVGRTTTAHTPAADHAAEAGETARWLEHALQALPFAQREAVLLCAVEQLPQSDVAEILGVPVNTVKTLLRRGRQGLARAHAEREATLHEEVLR